MGVAMNKKVLMVIVIVLCLGGAGARLFFFMNDGDSTRDTKKCPACQATGKTKDGKPCPTCFGTGSLMPPPAKTMAGAK